MTEEQITKAILRWLNENGWDIICFDFPQSGTGYSLHPNEEIRTTKNKGSIIPDIIAIKDSTIVFFENKDHFVLEDFVKVNDLRIGSDYSESITRLLAGQNYTVIYYGVGLPSTTDTHTKSLEHIEMIDFAVFVNADGTISILDHVINILWH